MKQTNVFWAVLAVAGIFTACSACQGNSANESNKWNLCIKTGKADLPVLNADGTANTEGRVPYAMVWQATDEMELFSKGEILDTVWPKETGAGMTSVCSIIQGHYAVGDTVELFLPPGDIDFTGQDGTEETALENYYYADGFFLVKTVDSSDNLITTNDSVMNPKQAYVEFRFSDAAARPVNVRQLTIRSASGYLATHGGISESDMRFDDLVVNAAVPASKFFVALRNKLHDHSDLNYKPETDVADTYTLTAVSIEGDTYTATWKARLPFGYVYLADILLDKK